MLRYRPIYMRTLEMAGTRVLLVDDDSLVRKVLSRILADHEDIEVVGEAATGEEAISSVGRLEPHVVVLDIRMPKMDGVAAAREIRSRYPQVKIIGLSELPQQYEVFSMQKAGVSAVYYKSQATEQLYAAIKKATAE
jgi:DNA-binding NarL/FixJ family response regulator